MTGPVRRFTPSRAARARRTADLAGGDLTPAASSFEFSPATGTKIARCLQIKVEETRLRDWIQRLEGWCGKYVAEQTHKATSARESRRQLVAFQKTMDGAANALSALSPDVASHLFSDDVKRSLIAGLEQSARVLSCDAEELRRKRTPKSGRAPNRSAHDLTAQLVYVWVCATRKAPTTTETQRGGGFSDFARLVIGQLPAPVRPSAEYVAKLAVRFIHDVYPVAPDPVSPGHYMPVDLGRRRATPRKHRNPERRHN